MSRKPLKVQTLVPPPLKDYQIRGVDAVSQRLINLEALVGRLEARITRLERKGMEHDE
jgi:hypothetical protein